MEDIDNAIFEHVNSFFHSVTGKELKQDGLLAEHVNEAPKLALDERSEYASSKINKYFHALMRLLKPEQVNIVTKIHRTLNEDIYTVLEYFH